MNTSYKDLIGKTVAGWVFYFSVGMVENVQG